MIKNAHFDWECFSPEEYFAHNYNAIRHDDVILARMLNEYCSAIGKVPHHLDVGAGSNLMPFLVCAPFCEQSTLMDYANSNCDWLTKMTTEGLYADHWHAALPEIIAASPPPSPLIQQCSLFDLKPKQCDLATMFFCIESITSDPNEFQNGVRCFIDSINHGGAYFVAMMKNSKGYSVGGVQFPALPVEEQLVEQVFSDFSHDVTVRTVEKRGAVLREGYDGFIVVTGRRFL